MSHNPLAGTRRLVAGTASGALAASFLLLAAPAQAAGSESVTLADIAPNESTYAGWHQGAANASGRYGVSSEGLKQVGKSQIIRGYVDNSNANLKQGGVNADVSALIGAQYDVTAGRAFFQLPIFIDNDGSNATPGVFATLRPVDAATGDTTIDGDDVWTVSRSIPGVEANAPTPLSDIVEAIDDRNYKTIGFGTFTDTGSNSTIASISFNDTTYTFAAGATTSTTVKNADVKGVEEDNYTSWHQGYPNSAGRQFVGVDGLELEGRSQVIKGFDNNNSDLDVVNASLASVLDDASYTVAEGSDDVVFQIPLRSNAIAGNQFTTLRATVSGAGKHSLADLTWQANKAVGSIPANSEKPIEEFVAALGTYKVIGFGVLTVPGTSAVVTNVTFAGQSYDFADAPVAATETDNVLESDIAPDEDVYEGWHQGAATNSARIIDGALALGADRSQIIKGYANNTQTFDGKNANLPDVLRGASYTVKSGTVFFQLPMFFKDPQSGATAFTTLRTTAPAEQGVNTFNRLQKWTSSKAIGGVVEANGSARMGEILGSLTDYKVLAFGVYSDAGANGVVENITWDGTRYTFVDADPTAANVSATTRSGDPVKVTLKGADAETTPVTYAVGEADNGSVTLEGDVATYTPDDGFDGQDTFTYTVSDGGFNTVEGTVTVTISGNGAPVVTPGQTGTVRAGGDRAAVVNLVAADPENDAIDSFQLVGQPANGSAFIFANGRLVVIPDEDVAAEQDETITVKVTATDARGKVSAPVDVVVTVLANKAPVVVNIDRSVRANGSTSVDLVAADPEGDAVTFSVSEPSKGTVTLSGSKATYTNNGTAGADSFTYTATDSRGARSTAAVNITVSANNNPVAPDASTTSPVGVNKSVTLAATDADGDDLTYSVVSGNGALAGNVLTVSVPADSIAARIVTYQVGDGQGGTDTGTVTVTPTKAVATTKLSVTPSPLKVGNRVTARISVASTAVRAGGPVDVTLNGKTVASGKLSSTGSLVLNLGTAKKGTYKVVAKFRGNALNFAASSPTVTVTVK